MVSSKQVSTPARANSSTPETSEKLKKIKSPRIGLDKIDELINKRVIEIVELYISKFTLFIDEYEKLLKEKEAIEKKNRDLTEERHKQSSMTIIQNMQKEINFLKDELERKDDIIKLITEERKQIENAQLQTIVTKSREDTPIKNIVTKSRKTPQ